MHSNDTADDALYVQQRIGYLYARVTAPSVSPTDALRHVQRMTDECTSMECDRILVEWDVPKSLADGDIFATVGELVAKNPSVRFAFVSKHPQQHEAMQFAQQVAAGKGADCRYFVDDTTARRWLLS